MKKYNYHKKYALFPPLITEEPSVDLQLVIVIPCYDEPHLERTLNSISNCDIPAGTTEVIVVINHGENAPVEVKEHNKRTFEKGKKWTNQNCHPKLKFYFLRQFDLPSKSAGVGLARKIGMDEAARRFNLLNKEDGIILCFDADSQCEPNYLKAVYAHFCAHLKTPACSICFEHPLEGNEFNPEIYQAIIEYELHLRYYVQAKRWAGFPYAFHTVGSSMAVRSIDYQKQGGMNRRQAGEDFYFLHKFTSDPHFSTVNTTTVIPSPRPSHRVPFGTGKAVSEQIQGIKRCSYDPELFKLLASFFNQIEKLYSGNFDLEKEIAPVLIHFLNKINLKNKIEEIYRNTTSLDSFTKRFFHWFNAFQIMKFLHFARERGYPDIPVFEAAQKLYSWINPEEGKVENEKELLLKYRKLDRKI